MASKEPYKAGPAGDAGNGTFATRDFAEGEVIWREARPFLAVLDSPRLKEACAWCFTYVGEKTEDRAKLKVCTGCKILRFCDVLALVHRPLFRRHSSTDGQKCQTAAWKHSHKLECKIYCKMHPAVLPNTARMVVQLLLRRKAGLMQQTELDAFLALRHHLEDFRRSDSENDVYGNLQLMARAGQEYSGTGDNISQVETIAGASYALKAIKEIKNGDELTTSYIDCTFPINVRRTQLSERYFFKCKCSACANKQTLQRPDPPRALTVLPQATLQELMEVEDSAAELLMGATGQNSAIALPQLVRALLKFSMPPVTKVHYPAWRQPLAKIRAELTLALLAVKRWTPALIQSIIQHLDADSVTYPSPTHPVRVARLWVLARLVGEVGSRANEGDPDVAEDMFSEVEAAKALGERFQIEWGVLVWVLVSDAAKKVVESHGPNNTLTIEIMKQFTQLQQEMREMGGTVPSRATLKPAWERLADMAKHGWEWWREWERKRVERSGRLIAEGDMKGVLEGMELLYSTDPD